MLGKNWDRCGNLHLQFRTQESEEHHDFQVSLECHVKLKRRGEGEREEGGKKEKDR